MSECQNRTPAISFSVPDITESEINAVADTLRSGWITTGARVKEFEKKIAQFYQTGFSETGTPRCVCLNSQTACAEMSLRLLGIGEGDEVIVPAYTYTATASVVCHVGATLVLVDTQPDSLEMDYDKVESLITEKTKAIIPVDIAGVVCDYDRIYSIVESKRSLFTPKNEIQRAIGRVAVVADTAHAFGAKRNGVSAGAIADFSNTSFHAVKNLTTAEGGALSWRRIDGISDDEIYRTLQLYSLHGQSKDALAKKQIGSWEYDVFGTWYKCNMTDVHASIGLSQLARYPEMLARRRQIIEMYDSRLLPLGIKVLPHYTDFSTSSGHLYMTRIDKITEEERNEIIVKMAERGVPCNVHYKPLPMLTAYKSLGFDIKNFPNSYKNYSTEITLPLHSALTDEQAEYIIDCYTDVLKDYLK